MDTPKTSYRKAVTHTGNEAILLNEEYAMGQNGACYYIYPYFEDKGKIHDIRHAGSIILDQKGMRALSEFFCGNEGGCKFLEEAHRAIRNLKEKLDPGSQEKG
jgi:hypothetical protein